jgi:hypothetical protein
MRILIHYLSSASVTIIKESYHLLQLRSESKLFCFFKKAMFLPSFGGFRKVSAWIFPIVAPSILQ